MLYLICLYIGSATNFALYYSFNSSIATTTGTALPAIDSTPIASAKNPKSISYIYLWILLVVTILRPFLLLCRRGQTITLIGYICLYRILCDTFPVRAYN